MDISGVKIIIIVFHSITNATAIMTVEMGVMNKSVPGEYQGIARSSCQTQLVDGPTFPSGSQVAKHQPNFLGQFEYCPLIIQTRKQ